jgi:hypothetical protein
VANSRLSVYNGLQNIEKKRIVKRGEDLMIEIKFREWFEERMLSWNEIQSKDLGCILGGNFEVMQFTGRRDKKGKEVYTGDIIKTKQYGIKEVTFACCGFGIIHPDLAYVPFYVIGDDIEVIGNIYENPKLLKEGV